MSENGNTIQKNLWDTMKAVLQGKLISLSACIYQKKSQRAQISDIMMQLKIWKNKNES